MTHEETLFTSDTSSGRECVHYLPPRIDCTADETPPPIKSVEWEALTRHPYIALPIPQSSIDAARIAALEAEVAKLKTDAQEWEQLVHQALNVNKLLQERLKKSSEEENKRLREQVENLQRLVVPPVQSASVSSDNTRGTWRI